MSGASWRKSRREKGIPLSQKEQDYKKKSDRSRWRKQRLEMREELNRIKIENGCVDCGYNDHSEALEFDHIPGCEKVANISAMLGWGSPQDGLVMQRIRAEIEKCEVVCANCHRIRTANRRSTRD